MAIRAVVFDLFDTLVDLSMHGLPRVEIGGRSVPSTAGTLHEVVVAHSDVDFERFIAALTEVDRTFRETRYAQADSSFPRSNASRPWSIDSGSTRRSSPKSSPKPIWE